MKGITYCGACADYDIKKHRCKRGAKLESNPQDKFLMIARCQMRCRWFGAKTACFGNLARTNAKAGSGARCWIEICRRTLSAISACERMKNEMNDKIPYAGILEDGIRKLTEGKAQNAVLCGLLEDGTTCVAYANASPEDLANIACHLLSEAFMRMVIANIGMVKDALDEYEDEEGGESNG